MPVFDFSNTPSDNKEAICTYETFASNESVATEENPILVLDNSNKKWSHHSVGKFTNPIKRTSFIDSPYSLWGLATDKLCNFAIISISVIFIFFK